MVNHSFMMNRMESQTMRGHGNGRRVHMKTDERVKVKKKDCSADLQEPVSNTIWLETSADPKTETRKQDGRQVVSINKRGE